MDDSIQTLPAATVRALGSSQALANPAAIAKELVDNALDAGATSVSLDIAYNTVDTIQVRDDGHGVAPDSRALLCKNHCTSKIRHFSDIEDVGGRYLGFRGEALACIVEVSGSVALTTRVEGEEVATTTYFQRRVSTKRSETCSHPVGTTVRVSDIFRSLPVRRQTAVKDAARCLSELKRLIQSYAFARPSIRFSLRVLKSTNARDGLVYVPQKDASLHHAALKLVGSVCTGQCILQHLELGGYVLTALMPKHDASITDLGHTGPFVSVDGRPLTPRRGVSRDIFTRFKERWRNINSEYASARSPFMCLQVKCPNGSYDPNVEPSKDDVVWKDSQFILDAFDKLLDQAYGNLPVSKSQGINRDTNQDPDFEVSPAAAQMRQAGHKLSAEDSDENTGDALLNNPWVKAKMGARMPPQGMPFKPHFPTRLPLQESAAAKNRSLPRSPARAIPLHSPWTVPTPPTSPKAPEYALSDSRAVRADPAYEASGLQARNKPLQSEQELVFQRPQFLPDSRQVPMDVYMRKRPLQTYHTVNDGRLQAPNHDSTHHQFLEDEDLSSLVDRQEPTHPIRPNYRLAPAADGRDAFATTADMRIPSKQHEYSEQPRTKKRRYNHDAHVAYHYDEAPAPNIERPIRDFRSHQRLDTHAGSPLSAPAARFMSSNHAIPLQPSAASPSEESLANESSNIPLTFVQPANNQAQTVAPSEEGGFLELEEPWSSLCKLMLHSHISIPEIARLCHEIEKQLHISSKAKSARAVVEWEASATETAGQTVLEDIDPAECDVWKRKARQLVQQAAQRVQDTSKCPAS